jgi:hypothetical protein
MAALVNVKIAVPMLRASFSPNPMIFVAEDPSKTFS